ncbi:hypothetical protein PACILC2_25830 [Paenibacillus cisolokensis]|uniref:SLH domain-containing protein n=1 Tax=Paenibacillus cisolokensis TaxID=1658519 RepID=A0ABQ4N748_9BACL|nr:S-layer homology domain-containing protein [Paenibacillus cisolokensis]GIQ64015.1 hypothetical protein PACILC2_25830 [Paenibacillus cisolokensis]
MFRKLGIGLVVLALMVQLLPFSGVQQVSAATGSFTFPSESDRATQPRITTDSRVTLTGTITGVSSSSISYHVYQIIDNNGTDDPNDDLIGSKRENVTSNIYVNGSTIQIYNLELFPGLNRITFQGMQGGGEVSNSIYIEYRNGPVFYNLSAELDGNRFEMSENSTTVVHSQPSRGRANADITISGNAPNAQSVTIIVNGSSKTYSVNSTNNFSFVAAPINVRKGKNLVTIKISNASQTIETTREVVFYNGSVTFYDVNINDPGGATEALEYNPNLIVTDINNLTITGKVIVPNSYHPEAANPNTNVPHPDPTQPLPIKYTLKQGAATVENSTVNGAVSGTYKESDPFFIFEYTIPLTGSLLQFNKAYNLQLLAENEVNKRLGVSPTEEGTDELYFSLRDANTPYVYQVNYLPGYKPTSYESLSGTKLEGANIYGLPLGMEILIGNPGAGGHTVDLTKVTSQSGQVATLTAADYEIKPLSQQLVTRTVDGVARTFQRIVIELKKLPFEGTQTIEYDLNGTTGQVTFNMLFGPFVKYDGVFDGMVIDDDTTSSTRLQDIIDTKLKKFKGQLLNINNTNEIRYEPDTANNKPQTIFFYINNLPVKIVPVSGSPNDTNFVLDNSYRQQALDALFAGENEIRFVFQGSKNFYEKTIKINLVPTNLPVIPVAGTSGVFPYSSNLDEPLPNDPNFPLSGSVYTTTKPDMNIYGTFDFIDLGTSYAAVDSRLGAGASIDPAKYILKITGSTLKEPISWDLSKPFYVIDSSTNQTLGIYPSTGSISGLLTVYYDVATQSFSFILKDQKLNADGSPSVYNFYVYNSGETGPRASYRLEVDPTSLPYDILRPILPHKSIVNQNFIEVIINAPGANNVVINKMQAEKIDFDSDNDGVIDYPGAYRAMVTGLKSGDNKINFTITSANDTISDSFTIRYVPTNIPGAQVMEGMKSSHKVFEGSISLKFEKNTSLIRRDFNVPANLKNQVFSGHQLLFGIANPEDGVVDRREFETLPANFDRILESFGTRFRVSFPTRFTKASPVYWIDAGLADDPNTKAYDPLKYGVDPYQYPGTTGPGGTKIPTYDERPDDRELITSKAGELTLAFDPNMRDSIGTIITVFRYDVKGKYWENMGGVVDTKKNTVTVPFTQFGYYVVGKMVYSFTDITSHPYARNYMEAIYAKGIMNAAGFDEFGGDMYITRGEFARMIVKALDIPLNYELSKPHFDDVPNIINPDALWDFRYIETAAREGIIRGTFPRTFEPNSNLTRMEAALIMARALDLKLQTDPDKIQKDLEKQFKDASDVSYYAKAAVSAVAKKGYIVGAPVDANDPKKGFVFEPRSNLLRSDAAIIVGRILADLKRLPKIN